MLNQSLAGISRQLIIICLVLGFAIVPQLQGQPEPAASRVAEITVKELISSIKSIDQIIAEKREGFSSELLDDESASLTAEIKSLEQQKTNLRNSVIEKVSGIYLEESDSTVEQAFSWNNEFRVLLEPLINELKKVTAEPRQIEKLKSDVNLLKAELKNAEQVVTSFSKAAESGTAGSAGSVGSQQFFAGIIAEWQKKLEIVQAKYQVKLQKLQQRENNKKTFTESVENVFDLFFKTRGRNLFLAVVFSALFWFFLFYFEKLVRLICSRTKYLNQKVASKMIQVTYIVLSVIGVIAVFGLTLYLLNDWVLLILYSLILLGLVWSTKTAIPRYWSQVILLTNSGPVREDQRIVFAGIPYRIRRIQFYTLLQNPLLEGGIIKIPLNDLLNYRSRKSGPDEPWFPTQKNDWVVFNDFFGQVISQSPETTVIKDLGGSIISPPSSEFINDHPVNLSNGYRLNVTFGIDYRHQAIILTEALKNLTEHIKAELPKKIQGKLINNINVEFAGAGASSLNLAVIVDFYGSAAKYYRRYERIIQTLCVEVCNQHKYVIPFDQLSVHLESDQTKKLNGGRDAQVSEEFL